MIRNPFRTTALGAVVLLATSALATAQTEVDRLYTRWAELEDTD